MVLNLIEKIQWPLELHNLHVGDACAAEAVGNLKAMCEGIDTR
jgi:hypothetical protein